MQLNKVQNITRTIYKNLVFKKGSEFGHWIGLRHSVCVCDCIEFSHIDRHHSRLDYGNFMFVGLPAYPQRRLRTVLTAAVRLIFRPHV